MKKMTLDLDSLVVESFDTSAETRRRGTVRGHDSLGEPMSDDRTECFCPVTGLCIDTDDDASCGQTLCGQATCTCPPPTVDQFTCATACVDTCFRCPTPSIQAFC